MPHSPEVGRSMTVSGETPELIDRAVWVATALTSLVAIGVAALGYFAHRWFVRKTTLSLLGGILLALAFMFVALVAPLVVEQLVNLQLGTPPDKSPIVAFVDPSLLVNLAPGIAMVIAWAIFWHLFRSRAA